MHSVLNVIKIGWSHLQSASNKQFKFVYFGRVCYFNWQPLNKSTNSEPCVNQVLNLRTYVDYQFWCSQNFGCQIWFCIRLLAIILIPWPTHYRKSTFGEYFPLTFLVFITLIAFYWPPNSYGISTLVHARDAYCLKCKFAEIVMWYFWPSNRYSHWGIPFSCMLFDSLLVRNATSHTLVMNV